MATPTRTPTTPTRPDTIGNRRTTNVTVPSNAATVGATVEVNGKTYLIVGVTSGAVSAAPGGGGQQQVQAVEVKANDTIQSIAEYRNSLGLIQQQEARSSSPTATPTPRSNAPAGSSIFDVQRENFNASLGSKQAGGGGGQATTGMSFAEAETACRAGDINACQTLLIMRDALPDEGAPGAGGRTFDQDIALQSLQGSQALEQIRAQLFPTLQANARTSAQGVTENISTGLSSALGALGFAAPQMFLAQGEDPAALKEALLSALTSGEGIFPTLERQQLVAEAAQSPKDIIRLLFLSGGQTPPSRRMGAFNAPSVLEEGKAAREDLARQITAISVPSLDELIQRFTPPLPGAAKGVVVEMKRNKGGTYEAAGGSLVTEGPELFTVGENGKKEFALLAPGSIIAPQIEGDEDTRENAVRAVNDMLLYGKRQMPAKAAKGGKVKRMALGGMVNGLPSDWLGSGLVSEDDQPLNALHSILTGAEAASAALQKPSRGLSDRISDMRLQMFPFEQVTPEQRATVLGQVRDNPLLSEFFNIGMTDAARNPAQSGMNLLAADRTSAEGRVREAMIRYFASLGIDFNTLPPEQQADLIARQMQVHAPDIAQLLQPAPSYLSNGELAPSSVAYADRAEARDLQLIEQYGSNAQMQGIYDSLLNGASGNQIPVAAINALPEGARAAVITALGSIFGSDVIDSILGLNEALNQKIARQGEVLSLGSAARGF